MTVQDVNVTNAELSVDVQNIVQTRKATPVYTKTATAPRFQEIRTEANFKKINDGQISKILKSEYVDPTNEPTDEPTS